MIDKRIGIPLVGVQNAIFNSTLHTGMLQYSRYVTNGRLQDSTLQNGTLQKRTLQNGKLQNGTLQNGTERCTTDVT